MPSSAQVYYDQWYKNANTQLQHPNDWERFYMFISILLKFSKKNRDADWLIENLKRDCPEFGEREITKLGILFDHLRLFYPINKKSMHIYWDNKASINRE
ncbi:hypothetical protein C0581_03845 [Candidatus Parcubacteria bacterium]|nr:MAG: hypothetical protein C0581_03845 [Candidatus Parcubacteria bacterium]